MCPSNYKRFWDTARYLWKKLSFYHTPLHSTPPLGGFTSEYWHRLWYGKTRMVSLPDSENISKICLFVLTWSTNVTDGQTDRHCMTAKTALASHRVVKKLQVLDPAKTNSAKSHNTWHREPLAKLVNPRGSGTMPLASTPTLFSTSTELCFFESELLWHYGHLPYY